MKYTDTPITLFTREHNELYKELQVIMEEFELKDPSRPYNDDIPEDKVMEEMNEVYKPEFLDENGMEFKVSRFWRMYLSTAFLQGKRAPWLGKKYADTSAIRKSEIKEAIKQLKYVPSGESLKKRYNLSEKFDDFCQVIDKDINSLK